VDDAALGESITVSLCKATKEREEIASLIAKHLVDYKDKTRHIVKV
jgi:hypothetical protein